MPKKPTYKELEQRVTETDTVMVFVKPFVVNLYGLSISGGGCEETPVQTSEKGPGGQA